MTEDPVKALYPEMLLAHASAPRNTGALDDATGQAHAVNPVCGDRVRVWVRVSETGVIDAVRIDPAGCALSKASASIMTTALKGKTMDAARAAITEVIRAISTGDAAALAPFGEAPCLAGVSRFPGRVKCVTMAWHAAEDALGD